MAQDIHILHVRLASQTNLDPSLSEQQQTIDKQGPELLPGKMIKKKGQEKFIIPP
jgi:hypothetical protein